MLFVGSSDDIADDVRVFSLVEVASEEMQLVSIFDRVLSLLSSADRVRSRALAQVRIEARLVRQMFQPSHEIQTRSLSHQMAIACSRRSCY